MGPSGDQTAGIATRPRGPVSGGRRSHFSSLDTHRCRGSHGTLSQPLRETASSGLCLAGFSELHLHLAGPASRTRGQRGRLESVLVSRVALRLWSSACCHRRGSGGLAGGYASPGSFTRALLKDGPVLRPSLQEK